MQVFAQSRLTIAANDFDCDRYGQIAAIAAEMMVASGMGAVDGLHILFVQQQGYATLKYNKHTKEALSAPLLFHVRCRYIM